MEKFISAAGTALRISDTGDFKVPAKDLPVLVLLHGYLESLNVWEELTALLKDDYRVISLDLPGHGISEVKGEVHTMQFLARTVNAAISSLGIDRYYVVGHSMGGYAALELLKNYPGPLEGIVLFHSSPNADTEEKRTNRSREIELVRAGKKELLSGNISKCFAPPNREKMRDRITELIEQIYLTEEDGIVALLNGMCARSDNNKTLRDSTVPQMFIFGRMDEYITMDMAETIAANHPQAGTVWLDNSAHMGLIEEAELSAVSIREFCK